MICGLQTSTPFFRSGGAESSTPLMNAQASLSEANFLKEADGNLSTWLLHSSLKTSERQTFRKRWPYRRKTCSRQMNRKNVSRLLYMSVSFSHAYLSEHYSHCSEHYYHCCMLWCDEFHTFKLFILDFRLIDPPPLKETPQIQNYPRRIEALTAVILKYYLSFS